MEIIVEELAGTGAPAGSGPCRCHGVLYECCPDRVRDVLDAGATRLHLVDLDGAKAGRPQNGAIIRDIASELTIPCQLGGGLRDDAALDEAFQDLGVERVIIGTAALKNPDWFRAAAKRRPHQLLLGLDARDGRVATEGWLDVSETPAVELARQFDDVPLGGIIYTNIANDGMMQGVDDGTLDDLAPGAASYDVSLAWHPWVGARESLRTLTAVDAAERERHAVGLAAAAAEALGVSPTGSSVLGVPVRTSAEETRGALTNAGIAAGFPAGQVRFSFHMYNVRDDVARLVEALTPLVRR